MVEEETKQFISIWMAALKSGGTLKDVALELGVENTQRIASRASYLRKLGYNLPRLNPGMKARRNLQHQANEEIKKHLASL